MTTIEPTTSGRIVALDVLRGVAVLGILLANISYFAHPMGEEAFGMRADPLTGADATVAGMTLAFVTAKFRSMLAVLFGVGLYLQFQKRSQVAGNWPGGYLKRMLWLGVFGLFHGFFLWYGDILFLYSLIGFVACFFAAASERVIRWVIGVLGAGAVFGGIALMAIFLALGNLPAEDDGLSKFFSAERELQIYAEGSYLDQLGFRSIQFALFSVSQVFWCPAILPLFLIGILLGRSGALARPSSQPKTRVWMLGIGIGLGLPLNLLGLRLGGSENLLAYSMLWELALGPILAIGYLMAIAMWVESGRLAWLQWALAQVGRVALTCYLMQTLLCTFFFYSWGLGFFGRLTTSETLWVVAAVWALNVAFAIGWLRKFSIGPVEWLWRSLTEGRRIAWRHDPAPAMADGGR